MSDSAKRDQIPLGRAISIIFISTLLVSGTAALGWFYSLHLRHERAEDPRFTINTVAQHCLAGPVLETDYLMELMGLSRDYTINLYALDLQQSCQRLLASPHIRKVRVNRMRPGTVVVSYCSRTPWAYLLDYTNTVLDAEGYLFPAAPFFSPKRLPNIYLGIQAFGEEGGGQWGQPLELPQLILAREVVAILEEVGPDLQLDLVDVKNAYAKGYGDREVVVAFTDIASSGNRYPRMARFHTSSLHPQLQRLLTLRQKLLTDWPEEKQPKVIDMRTEKIALLGSRFAF